MFCSTPIAVEARRVEPMDTLAAMANAACDPANRARAYDAKYPPVTLIKRSPHAYLLARPGGEGMCWVPRASCTLFAQNGGKLADERPDRPDGRSVYYDICRIVPAAFVRAKLQRAGVID